MVLLCIFGILWLFKSVVVISRVRLAPLHLHEKTASVILLVNIMLVYSILNSRRVLECRSSPNCKRPTWKSRSTRACRCTASGAVGQMDLLTSSGKGLVLGRVYSWFRSFYFGSYAELFAFHCKLLDAFPDEAGLRLML